LSDQLETHAKFDESSEQYLDGNFGDGLVAKLTLATKGGISKISVVKHWASSQSRAREDEGSDYTNAVTAVLYNRKGGRDNPKSTR
jgi:hypothetical protein